MVDGEMVNLSQGELERCYDEWTAGNTTFRLDNGKIMPMMVDIHLIRPMLEDTGGVDDDGHTVYRCRFFSNETHMCGIYKVRPAMCRNYPQGKCGHPGCSLEEVK
jgi:Fe-S-cluster containining protein